MVGDPGAGAQNLAGEALRQLRWEQEGQCGGTEGCACGVCDSLICGAVVIGERWNSQRLYDSEGSVELKWCYTRGG